MLDLNRLEIIRRVGIKYNIKTAFPKQNTLMQRLVKNKPKNGRNLKTVFYSIKCSRDRVYIEETKIPINVRIKAHKGT